jgi:Domain of unknown function (DUF6268)
MRQNNLFFLFIAVALFFLNPAFADQQEKKNEPVSRRGYDYRQRLEEIIVEEKPEEILPQELDAYARYMPFEGAKAQSGKVGIFDSASEYSYDIKAFGKLPVQLGLITRYIGIENTTAVELPAHLTQLSFGAETTIPFFNFNKTYITLGLAPSFLTDNWNFNPKSFRMLQRYFLIYQFNPKWTFIYGVGVFPGYKPTVLPILGFIYKPNDSLTFNIVPKNPEISYLLNKKITVFAEADVSGDEFEVTKDNFKNVVLNYNETHLGVGLRYKLNKYTQWTISSGAVFNRSIKYRQDSLGKVTIKDGPYINLRLDIQI